MSRARARALRRPTRESRWPAAISSVGFFGLNSVAFLRSRGGGALLNAAGRLPPTANLLGPPGHSLKFFFASAPTHDVERSSAADDALGATINAPSATTKTVNVLR